MARAPAWGLNVTGFIFLAAAPGTCSAEGEAFLCWVRLFGGL